MKKEIGTTDYDRVEIAHDDDPAERAVERQERKRYKPDKVKQGKKRMWKKERKVGTVVEQVMAVPKGSTSVEDLIEDTLTERELDPETITVLKDLIDRVQATRGKDADMVEELEASMREAGFDESEVKKFVQRAVLGQEELLPEAEEEDDDRVSEIREEIRAQEKREEHVPAGKGVREGPEKGEHRKQKKERSIMSRWLGLFSPKKERGKGKGPKVRRRIKRSMQGKRTGGRKSRTFRDAA